MSGFPVMLLQELESLVLAVQERESTRVPSVVSRDLMLIILETYTESMVIATVVQPRVSNLMPATPTMFFSRVLTVMDALDFLKIQTRPTVPIHWKLYRMERVGPFAHVLIYPDLFL